MYMYMSSLPQSCNARRVVRVLSGVAGGETTGATRPRIVAVPDEALQNPFLRLESHGTGDSGGHVDHPGRGVDIVTFEMDTGDVRWVTCGPGMMENGLPRGASERSVTVAFDLSATEILQAPAIRVIPATDVPAVIFPSVEVRVVAGRFHGLLGPVNSPSTSPFLADIILQRDGDVTLDIPENHAGLVFVVSGGVAVEQTLINAGQAGVLAAGNTLTLVAGADGARALVMTACPLKPGFTPQGAVY